LIEEVGRDGGITAGSKVIDDLPDLGLWSKDFVDDDHAEARIGGQVGVGRTRWEISWVAVFGAEEEIHA
jgi:hypothetical protein